METDVNLNFNIPPDSAKIIKVIGIGGGGVNMVNYMYNEGIYGVNFAVCNTDAQSFDGVNVPVKIALGDGLGAGGNLEKGKVEFEKSASEVEKLLTDGTRMIFIASGMGGGTGSSAAPLLAKMAKSQGILTVGIVTIPFFNEKLPRINQALDAVEELSKNVDALIVINNERLNVYYPDDDIQEAYKKPNEVLAMAVKSIAEIITLKGTINRDFNDVTTTMKDSGVAFVGYGFGSGENRLDDAIREAFNSPLLNNTNIYNAKRMLTYLTYKQNSRIKMSEYNKSITPFMGRFDPNLKVIPGLGVDDTLGEGQDVKFTIIVTGFDLSVIPEFEKRKDENDSLALQQQQEQEQKNLVRIKKIYGEEYIMSVKVTRVSPSSIVILTPEEMDEDAFINFLEENPTYNRSEIAIDKNRKPAKTAVNGAANKEDVTSSSGIGNTGNEFVIKFD